MTRRQHLFDVIRYSKKSAWAVFQDRLAREREEAASGIRFDATRIGSQSAEVTTIADNVQAISSRAYFDIAKTRA
jgi:hypothetical protein